MKVAITGHTSGIGKALYEMLGFVSIDPMGFALDNGYDIKDKSSRERIINHVVQEDFDCFVNNAFAEEGQLELLLALFPRWRFDASKTIINIGSFAIEIPVFTDIMIPYVARKSALRQAVFQMQRKEHDCRIIHVKFGFVDTPLSKSIIEKNTGAPYPALTPHAAATAIYKLIVDDVTYTQEITVTARRKGVVL